MVEYVEPEKEDKKKSRRMKRPQKIFSVRNIIIIFVAVFLLSSVISGFMYSVTDKIAVVPIKGGISVEGSGSIYESSMSSRQVVAILEQIGSDPTVKGVILDINSPGGSAVASEELGNAIAELKEQVPVYAVISESGTSGALWVSAAANKTYASRLSVVGSIGVTSVGLGFENFIEQYNITYRKQTAGEYKDLGSVFREPTTEEQAIIQGLLDDIHVAFIEHIADSRNLAYEEVEAIATGEIFLGSEALELGLIDEIGNLGDAYDEILNVTGAIEPIVIDYSPQPTLAQALGIESLFSFDTQTKVELR